MTEQDYEIFFSSVLEKLKEKRKEKGLTQGDLGKLIGKPQSAVARFESGAIKDPGFSMIYNVCKALEIRPGELLDSYFTDLSDSKKLALKKIIQAISEM